MTVALAKGRGNVGNGVVPAVVKGDTQCCERAQVGRRHHQPALVPWWCRRSGSCPACRSGTLLAPMPVAPELHRASTAPPRHGRAGQLLPRTTFAWYRSRRRHRRRCHGSPRSGRTSTATLAANVNTAFDLEHGGQAVAQRFSALETDVGRVGGNTGGVAQVASRPLRRQKP